MSPNKPVYVLDSFALLAYLNDEPGRKRVQEVLFMAEERKCRAVICLFNLGEVLYMIERRRDLVKAQSVQALTESLPLELLEVSRDLVLDAAHIKANHALSYADAFVVATAIREGGVILTGDPEFETVEPIVTVEWFHRK